VVSVWYQIKFSIWSMPRREQIFSDGWLLQESVEVVLVQQPLAAIHEKSRKMLPSDPATGRSLKAFDPNASGMYDSCWKVAPLQWMW
jgi:hypothetical protein